MGVHNYIIVPSFLAVRICDGLNIQSRTQTKAEFIITICFSVSYK